MEADVSKPKLLASTGAKFSFSINEFRRGERDTEGKDNDEEVTITSLEEPEGNDTNYFKSIEWSFDGTCLLTSSADNTIRTFIAPADLLSPHPSPVALTPYSSLPSPEPVYAITPYPFYSLQDQSTTLLLSSPRDLPIRLSNALYPSLLATYPLISPTTEAFLTPSSMIWTSEGMHFLTGTDCLIALFDITRTGSGPLTRLPTIPSKRHNLKGGGVGMRGIVSCLSLQPKQSSMTSSLLSAGTWTRWVGLYDAGGLGGTVANWSIASAADSTAKIAGAGVSQTLWSSCGRYLFVVERKSRGVLIYDIRVTGRLVGWLEGRVAETNQRLGVEIFGTMEGNIENANESEIWAGGVDGVVRVWKWRSVGGEGGGEVGLTPEKEWQAHESAVSGVVVHPSGTVVATSSGQRQEIGNFDEETDSDSDDASKELETSSTSMKRRGKQPDNSIKIWSIYPPMKLKQDTTTMVGEYTSDL